MKEREESVRAQCDRDQRDRLATIREEEMNRREKEKEELYQKMKQELKENEDKRLIDIELLRNQLREKEKVNDTILLGITNCTLTLGVICEM